MTSIAPPATITRVHFRILDRDSHALRYVRCFKYEPCDNSLLMTRKIQRLLERVKFSSHSLLHKS